MVDRSPTTIKELIYFLHDNPNLKVQTKNGKRKLSYRGFENGCFSFDEGIFNFCLYPKDLCEIGLTLAQTGFILERNQMKTFYYYGA